MKNIVLFASGSGTNAENIILFFKNNPIANVVAVFCNNANAKVIERANLLNVPTVVFNKEELLSDFVLTKLKFFRPDLIVLSGFLLMFPKHIIKVFPNKIINIHPALLPNYGGKGMYGMNVHQAVFDNKETETGITIHFVNENYDEGAFIFQKSTPISHCESPEAISKEIQLLEHQYFPITIENILKNAQ